MWTQILQEVGHPVITLTLNEYYRELDSLSCTQDVLSDNKIALLKKRIDKSRNVRLDKLNGEVAERLRPRYRSSDILLKQ